VLDEDMAKNSNVIVNGAGTEKTGNSKIFVLPVHNVLCVRTGYEGGHAV